MIQATGNFSPSEQDYVNFISCLFFQLIMQETAAAEPVGYLFLPLKSKTLSYSSSFPHGTGSKEEEFKSRRMDSPEIEERKRRMYLFIRPGAEKI
jgi:hypothetical protein